MAEPGRWVIVPDDPDNTTIVGGPYLWDGNTDWQPSQHGRLVREADALGDGYTYPPTLQP